MSISLSSSSSSSSFPRPIIIFILHILNIFNVIFMKICEKYSVDFSIMFNTSKSKLLVFSENPTDVKVNFQGNTIRQVKSETHVGHLMSNSPHIQERRVSQACKTLIGQFNLLSVKLGFCSPEVLYSLFQNYCMSLYGCQLWDYSNESVFASVFVTWRKCVRNIFSLRTI